MKLLIFFIILILLQNCSFDNKTGIWKNEKSFSKKENDIFKDLKVLNTKNQNYNKITLIDNNFKFIIPKAKNNFEWKDIYYNKKNNFENLIYNGLNQLAFKSKKITNKTVNNHILSEKNNIIATDNNGNIIVYSSNSKKIVAKYNFYKKKYKKKNKSLNILVENNIIFVADNIGYLYSYDYVKNKILWAKKYQVGFRSNVKILNDKLITSDTNNNLFFFNKKNGEVLKLIPTEETIVKNKFVNNISINNDITLFLNTYGSLYAINSDTMQILWFLNLNQSLDLNPSNLFYSNQIVADKEKIFVSSNKYTYIINLQSGGVIYKKNFSSKFKPIIINNYLFSITKNNLLIAMNIDNGKIIYSLNINQEIANFTGTKKKEVQFKNFFFSNNKLMIFLKNSYVIYFKTDGTVVDIFKLPSKLNTNPIIINKSLFYLDSKNKLSIVN
ncbi:PQQ-binding-like beta-propeller repeat protein [Pelagibacteraceae bacterium]|jgi:outer membrane protein assembly factor BamB|nr:PQQ-binding-like beta-propeller repeat protein [Pelagibacteraceae bacterium]